LRSRARIPLEGVARVATSAAIRVRTGVNSWSEYPKIRRRDARFPYWLLVVTIEVGGFKSLARRVKSGTRERPRNWWPRCTRGSALLSANPKARRRKRRTQESYAMTHLPNRNMHIIQQSGWLYEDTFPYAAITTAIRRQQQVVIVEPLLPQRTKCHR